MKLVFKTFFIYLMMITYGFAICSIKQPIISLSGPVTILLEELNLLSDQNLKAISSHHPIQAKTTATVVNGGIFLGKKLIHGFPENSIIFYDKSRDLKKLLTRHFSGDLIEIDTRSKDPFEVHDLTVELFKNKLLGCDQKLETLNEKLKLLEVKIKKSWKLSRVVFFLGEIKKKLPNLVMSNDGPVIWLKKKTDFKSYPSNLAYTPWSKKIIENLKETLFLGLNESDDKYKVTHVIGKKWNVYFRGALTPGLRQIYLLERLTDEKKFNL